MKIAQATATDLPEILELLNTCQLPTADIKAEAPQTFLIIRNEGTLIGVIGLERYSDTGLLRSLAIRPEYRGWGMGGMLTQELETHAEISGIATLVLLTETAQDFFAHHGYDVVDRRDVPAGVQASAEFHSLCPASAFCMRKHLAS